MSCTLRIFTFNDVYILDNFARVKNLIKEHRTENSIVVLPGDFLAPSLLSSLDAGTGMVDVMNEVGIDYVCIGNHEADVPHRELLRRIRESKFKWLNTNLQQLSMNGQDPLPVYDTITVTEGTHTRKIGLLGLLSCDKALYPSGLFLNTNIDDVTECYEKYGRILMNQEQCDTVVPLTHQSMADDRKLAKNTSVLPCIPVLLGGHDHDYYQEEIEGTKIIKTGQDAECVAMVDLTWETSEKDCPVKVTITDLMSKDFEPDEAIAKRSEGHQKILDQLKKANLCLLSAKKQLTSEHIRLKQTTMGSFLCSSMRDSLMANCCMFNSGGIRASKEYPVGKKLFTFADLEGEMPFSNDIVAVSMPGRVFSDAVAYSRRLSFLDPPVMSGGFMQIDGGCEFDDEKKEVTRIQYEPIDMDKWYQVVVVKMHLDGVDDQLPLMEFAKNYPDKIPDDGVSCKVSIVTHFSRNMLLQLGSFKSIDLNSDGLISREEFKIAANRCLQIDVIDFVVDKMFDVCDTNGDGMIDRPEMLSAVLFTAFCTFDTDKNGALDRDEIRSFAEKVMGEEILDIHVDKIIKKFDCDADGLVSFNDVRHHALKNIYA